MSTRPEVGFVAITNHILDAAKSNRCAVLLRQEPDKKELLSIARGVLFDATIDGSFSTRQVECHKQRWDPDELAKILCRSYTHLLHHKGQFKWFQYFFGLRDFIYFLKAMRRKSLMKDMLMIITLDGLIRAFERNFSGIDREKLNDIATCFLEPIVQGISADSVNIPSHLSHPMDIVQEAVTEISNGLQGKSRFKMIIDESEDDSIMRLLNIDGVLDLSKKSSLFKLSGMPEGAEVEKSRLVSGVKYCALQGNTAVLSQTEPVNESFYDLFNQNFRSLINRDGEIALFANIAVGGISRRSLIRPSFQCILHVRKSELEELPAPLLNRFEKYKLTIEDVLDSGCRRLGGARRIFINARKRAEAFLSHLGDRCIFGCVDQQTLSSIFVDMLPASTRRRDSQVLEYVAHKGCSSFEDHVIAFIRSFTSLTMTMEDISCVLSTAKKYFLTEDADILTQLVEEGADLNQESLKNAFCSIVSGSSRDPLARVAETVIQMVLARAAVFRLILLATPESIFSKRDSLPQQVVREYFQQEHFSLSSLIARILSTETSQNYILYTRTDAVIHSLPSMPLGQDLSQEKVGIIQELVHHDTDKLIIEHLHLLKNEAAVRNVIEGWASDNRKQVFVLVADMCEQHSINRVNFIRTVVEQSSCRFQNKVFLLLLHFPPSTSQSKMCYPTLFLGSWKHAFLDGIGLSSQTLNPASWIEAACRHGTHLDVKSTIFTLLPRSLSFAASQNLFYPGQVNHVDLFSERYGILLELMNKKTDESATIGEIICAKFSRLWTDRTLTNTLKRASDGLLHGTTQLSMSLSLQSVLQETFSIFLTVVIVEMNNWRNLDILSNCHQSKITDNLFGHILEGLPVPPFEELVLHRRTKGGVQSLATKHGLTSVRFPFFYFISSFLDSVVETAEASVAASSASHNGNTFQTTPIQDVLECAMDLIKTSDKGIFVQDIVETTRNSDITTVEGLFHRYLCHYIEWKVGCEPESHLLKWTLKEISKVNRETGNIVLIHIIASKRKVELLRLASLSSFGMKNKVCIVPSPKEFLACGGISVFKNGLQKFESSVYELLSSSSQWVSLFSDFLQISPIILTEEGGINEKSMVSDIRVLSFLHSLNTAKTPLKRMKEVIAYCYDKKKTQLKQDIKDDTSLEALLGMLKDSKSMRKSVWYGYLVETIFRQFLSPLWHQLKLYTERDLLFLLKTILVGNILDQKFYVVLLRSMCIVETTKAPVHGNIFNATTLVISDHIQCKNLVSFSPNGQRLSMPHFIPNWLRCDQEQHIVEVKASEELSTFFADYEHTFTCPLSEILFDMVLGTILQKSKLATSEEILLALMQQIEAECNVRPRSVNPDSASHLSSIPGSVVGAMIADAYLLCFVVKVAHELAINSRSVALSGTYSQLAQGVIQSVMTLAGYHWQDFFLNTIIRARGEGNLFSLLHEGGPLHGLSWCQLWVHGMPGLKQGCESALKEAEDKLAEALREEETKCRELRKCPSCEQDFTVLQRNCGTFVCGSDPHGNIGFGGVYGCGSTFNVDTAPYYTTDNSILDPLRKKIEKERRHLEQYNNGAMHLQRAKNMQVPILLFTLHNTDRDAPLVPTAILFDELNIDDDPSFAAIKILSEEQLNIEHFSFLPDFIEVRLFFAVGRVYVATLLRLSKIFQLTSSYRIFFKALHMDSLNFPISCDKRTSNGHEDIRDYDG